MRAVPSVSARAVASAVVVDRWPLMRVGLARGVNLAGLRAAGEARTLPEAAAMARQLGAGMLVLGDVDARALPALRRLPPDLVVAALVRRASRQDLSDLLAAGVDAVGLRSSTPEELGSLLRDVLAGERAIAVALVAAMFEGAAPGEQAPAGAAAVSGLTAKEHEVLAALAVGATNQEIAAQLFVTPATIKTHLAHIYAKLDVSGRHEALSRAVALGIVH